MLIDYEAAWHQLRAQLTTKSGHGTFGPEGLLARMAALEIECRVEEGPTERVLRLFGIQLSQDLINFPSAATGEEPIGQELSSDGLDGSKGDDDGHRYRIPVRSRQR